MNTHLSFFRPAIVSMLLLAAGLFLTSCEKPTQPVFDSFYDELGENFIPISTIQTIRVADVRANSALSGGIFLTNYGFEAAQKGICWATDTDISPDNHINGGCTDEGPGNNDFASKMTDLVAGTTYYVRAYAKNDLAIELGGLLIVNTMDGIVTMTTPEITILDVFSVRVTGTILENGGADVVRWGVCYDSHPDPEYPDANCISINPKLNQSDLVTELSSGGQINISESLAIEAQPTELLQFENGNNDIVRSETRQERSLHKTDSRRSNQSAFTPASNEDVIENISIDEVFADLQEGTQYYIRLFAVNGAGTWYSPASVVTMPTGKMEISTEAPSQIASNQARVHGTISDDGGSVINERGFCYSTTQQPTLSNTCITAGEGMGSFNALIENLQTETRYYVRSYGINSIGVEYGNEESFLTLDGRALVETRTPNAINAQSISITGEIINQGASSIIERGFCWSQNPVPNTMQSCLASTSTANVFTSTIENLEVDTPYFIRAYAVNQTTQSFGDEISFTTRNGVISNRIDTLFQITRQRIRVSVSILDNGGSSIIERGICYSESPNPTLASSCVAAETNNNNFVIDLAISPETRFYIRAYAINNVQTGFSSESEFELDPYFGRDQLTAVVEVFNPVTGRVWMDRNLGASRAALSRMDSQAYGDYYQWGRSADGHQLRGSRTTNVLSESDYPMHGRFIIAPWAPHNWRMPENNEGLWQGEDGVNNPCPAGFRIPTRAEWIQEMDTWSEINGNGAFNSMLKLSNAGERFYNNGELTNMGTLGRYWTSEPGIGNIILMDNFNVRESSRLRSYGASVRCIKD